MPVMKSAPLATADTPAASKRVVRHRRRRPATPPSAVPRTGSDSAAGQPAPARPRLSIVHSSRLLSRAAARPAWHDRAAPERARTPMR